MAPDFFGKIALMFSKPSELFRQVKGKESGEGFWKTFLFYLTVLLVLSGLSIIPSAFSGNFGVFSPVSSILAGLGALLYASILIIVLSKLFLGKNGWKETFKAVSYSMIPPLAVQSIPSGLGSFLLLPLGLIALGYSAVLLAKGLIVLNELSLGKAIGVIVVSILFTIGIMAIFLFGFVVPALRGIA